MVFGNSNFNNTYLIRCVDSQSICLFLESGFSKDGFNGMSIFGAVFMMPLAYLLCAKLFKRNVKTVFDIMTP